MKDQIQKIIEDGILAPSGENCQPWKFAVHDSVIDILNCPELDQSIYNFQQKGSYVAHGSLIENMTISAAKHRFSTKVELFPQKGVSTHIARLTLQKIDAGAPLPPTQAGASLPIIDGLYPFLSQRHTNRKDHTPIKLTDSEKKVLTDSANETGLGKLYIIDDQPSLDLLGKALAVNEQIIFENKALHDFFYEHILWNEDEQDKAGGFYIKTLEFLPHQLKGVKLFQKWPILKVLNKIGKVSQAISKENAKKYAQSGALAIITVDGDTDTDYVNAGRVSERVWLTATKLGLSVQPCTGVLYFMENLRAGNGKVFSKKHQRAIQDAYRNIMVHFKATGKTAPMLFRLGHSDAPTATAKRMKPNIIYSHE